MVGFSHKFPSVDRRFRGVSCIPGDAVISESIPISGQPLSIPAAIWYKAAKETYNDDDLVAVINDFSGNGNHLTGAGTARATFKTNIVNGKPIFRFNGTTNTLSKTSGVVGLSTGLSTLYVVVGNATFGVSAGMVISAQNAAGNKFLETRARFGPGDIWQVIAADGAGGPSDGAVGATFRAVGSVYPTGVGSNEIHCYEKSTFSAGAFETGVNLVDKISVGSRFGSLFLAQDIAEIIGYNSVLSAANIILLGNYFASEYAI